MIDLDPHAAPPSKWHPWEWVKSLPPIPGLLLPVVLGLFPIALAGIFLPHAVGAVVRLMSVTMLAIDAGIVVGLCVPFHWWFMLGIVAWTEFFILLWLIKNLDLARRIRWIDRFLHRQEDRALRAYQKHGWVRRGHFVGVMAFTFLPLGSGVFVGTFLGKVTGLGDRYTFMAVFFGTLVWASLLTLLFGLSLDPIIDLIAKVDPKIREVCG